MERYFSTGQNPQRAVAPMEEEDMHCIFIIRYYGLEHSRFLSWSHFCLQKVQHLLPYMFHFYHHRLLRPVYCSGWFCWFALIDSIMWLPYLQNVLLLILVYADTSVCLVLCCICWSVVEHRPYHISLCIVLLPVLGMLIVCGLLFNQIVDLICIGCLFLFLIFS